MTTPATQTVLNSEQIKTTRLHVLKAMKLDDIKQSEVSDKSGIQNTRLSQFLNDKYTGDNSVVAKQLALWIENHEEQKQKASTLPSIPSYYATETGQKIIDTLAYGHFAGDIVVIYGAAGTGKTQACKEYQATHNNVWIATMKASCKEIMPAVQRIASQIGLRDLPNSAAAISQNIEDKLEGSGGLLIIDEAQNLSVQALEEVRSWHDSTEIGIALVGNETVHNRLANKS